MSLKGIGSPRINDIILPSNNTIVKIKTSALYYDKKTFTNELYRVFNTIEDNLLYDIVYTITIENITKEEYLNLVQYDGSIVNFYPHYDSDISYDSYLNITEYNKNEKYEINSINIRVSFISGRIKAGFKFRFKMRVENISIPNYNLIQGNFSMRIEGV